MLVEVRILNNGNLIGQQVRTKILDALAHYIMMMYEVSQIDSYFDELNKAESNHSKNENYIKAAKSFNKIDFEKDIIIKLQNCIGNGINFKRHIKKLLNQGLLAHDDYSLVFFNS